MEKEEKKGVLYGILGYPLTHSFSRRWYENRGLRFKNFEYQDVEDFLAVIPQALRGFSVTIPHKETIMKYLSRVTDTAKEVGAVNCVKVEDGKLVGYNTDTIGFKESLLPLLRPRHRRAAILGSGGASKAVQWTLRSLGIEYQIVSRSSGGYQNFDPSTVDIVVNTTPLGMYPNVDDAPDIDYSRISEGAICYDLVYNPAQTQFLRLCRAQGALVITGLKMLYSQARAALNIYETK